MDTTFKYSTIIIVHTNTFGNGIAMKCPGMERVRSWFKQTSTAQHLRPEAVCVDEGSVFYVCCQVHCVDKCSFAHHCVIV